MDDKCQNHRHDVALISSTVGYSPEGFFADVIRKLSEETNKPTDKRQSEVKCRGG